MKGKLQAAVTHALNQKKELMRFLEATNNLAEHGIRPLAISRKNYLFSTSMKGETAKVNWSPGSEQSEQSSTARE